jgi:urease alpha subunit
MEADRVTRLVTKTSFCRGILGVDEWGTKTDSLPQHRPDFQALLILASRERYHESRIEEDASNCIMDQSMNSFESECEQPGHAGDITKREAEIGILPSHGMILASTHRLFCLVTG